MSKTSSPEITQIEKLLKVAFDNHATELRLSGGVPPMLRIGEQLKQLKIQPVSTEVVAGLIRAVMPDGADSKNFSFTCSHGSIDASVVEVSGTEVLVLKRGTSSAAPEGNDDALELDLQDDGDDSAAVVQSRSADEEFAMPEEAGGTIMIDKLLTAAVKGGVSDIHITKGLPPVFRQDGGMKPQKTKVLTADDTNSLMKSITPERCQAELAEMGGTDFGFAFGDMARFRVSVFKQRGSIAMVLRQIPNQMLTPEQLGVPDVCQRLVTRPRGLFLVTGPTGSGKSTTLASLINMLNEKFDHHIITIEDPIEFYHYSKMSTVNQREVGTDVTSFAEALKRALRQDPDVIMVGEIRDKDTAGIAIQASLTGHLVLSTIHTNDAASAMTRLVDMGVEAFLVASSLAGVLAQRLVRTVCDECAETLPLSDGACRELGVDPRIHAGKPVRRGKGCIECQDTGYKGRTGIYELLLVDDNVRELVLTNSDAARVKKAAREYGMETLREDGLRKILNGETTVAEVCRVTTEEAVLD